MPVALCIVDPIHSAGAAGHSDEAEARERLAGRLGAEINSETCVVTLFAGGSTVGAGRSRLRPKALWRECVELQTRRVHCEEVLVEYARCLVAHGMQAK